MVGLFLLSVAARDPLCLMLAPLAGVRARKPHYTHFPGTLHTLHPA
jgi:hypothetical protein